MLISLYSVRRRLLCINIGESFLHVEVILWDSTVLFFQDNLHANSCIVIRFNYFESHSQILSVPFFIFHTEATFKDLPVSWRNTSLVDDEPSKCTFHIDSTRSPWALCWEEKLSQCSPCGHLKWLPVGWKLLCHYSLEIEWTLLKFTGNLFLRICK